MLYERIEELAKKTKKSLNEIDRELGFPRNTLAGLKNRKPSIKRLNIIANYFGVTTDYLLGREDTNNKEDLTQQENELLAAFRMETGDMDEKEQAEFQEAIKDLMKKTRAMFDDPTNWKK